MRMQHAMELMREKLDNNLKALRENGKIDAMELRLTEQVENNQKSMELMGVDHESVPLIFLTLYT